MDDELLELVPVFVAEARERLQRLADLVPGLGRDSDSLVEIKRELHTLKGAGRTVPGVAPVLASRYANCLNHNWPPRAA